VQAIKAGAVEFLIKLFGEQDLLGFSSVSIPIENRRRQMSTLA
jgi:FixJ family two-component response regulator